MALSSQLGTFELGAAVLGEDAGFGSPPADHTLTPSGIPSSAAVGTPSLVGPTQSVFLTSPVHGPKVGMPTLAGGAQQLSVYVGGVLMSQFLNDGHSQAGLRWASLTVSSQAQGRWTATFDLCDPLGIWDGTPLLVADDTKGLGQSVVVIENGIKIFTGCLATIRTLRLSPSDAIIYSCTALDKSSICDHRAFQASYLVSQGWDIADIIRDIFTKVLLSPNEGLTITGVPASLGALENDEIFNWSTVTQAFDRLAQDAIAIWYVDVDGVIHFVVIASLPACPFQLTESSRNWTTDLEVDVNLNAYGNYAIVVSNLAINAANVPAVTETYTLPQARAVAAGYRLGTIVLNQTATKINSVKVNGVEQAVQNGYALVTNFDRSWWIFLPSPYLFAPDVNITTPTPDGAASSTLASAYTAGSGTMVVASVASFPPAAPFDIRVNTAPNNFPYVNTTTPMYRVTAVAGTTFSVQYLPGSGADVNRAIGIPIISVDTLYPSSISAFPQIGDVIEISYLGPSSSQVVAGIALKPTTPVTLQACGSGQYDYVEQVKDVSEALHLTAIAQAVLARVSVVPSYVKFRTFTPGAAVGQILHVDLPKNKLPNANLAITAITGRSKGKVDLGHGSSFEWQIEANSGLDRGNSIKWMEKLVRRTEHPLPIVQYVEQAFILEPGSSLAAGFVATNPFIVPTTGQLLEVVAAAGGAPIGQNLLISLFADGIPLLLAPLVIPDGSLLLAEMTSFADFPAPTWLLKNQILTISVAYVATSGPTTAAQSVTVSVRWSK